MKFAAKKILSMQAKEGLKGQHNCMNCRLRSESFFCHLGAAELRIFESLTVTKFYLKGAPLFMEGHPASGIYMLCQGRVKLSTCSRDGKVIIVRIVEAGEVLGLNETVSGSDYEMTAETLEPCQANFVRSKDFLGFLEQNAGACLRSVMQLSRNYHTAFIQVRTFGLYGSVGDRLAKLLLEWCNSAQKENDGFHLEMTYTHEEIAQMIGTSRESVTRRLKDFREQKLITINGCELVIHSQEALEGSIYSK